MNAAQAVQAFKVTWMQNSTTNCTQEWQQKLRLFEHESQKIQIFRMLLEDADAEVAPEGHLTTSTSLPSFKPL